MNIQHIEGDTKGEFYIEENSNSIAKITYTRLGRTQIIVDHTEVADELKGQNIGKKIVRYARDQNLKLIPLCPFANSIVERDESLQDVLKK